LTWPIDRISVMHDVEELRRWVGKIQQDIGFRNSRVPQSEYGEALRCTRRRLSRVMERLNEMCDDLEDGEE